MLLIFVGFESTTNDIVLSVMVFKKGVKEIRNQRWKNQIKTNFVE